MATRTTYYNLVKPSQTDLVDVRDLNTNFDNIDAIMHTNETNIDSLDGRITTAESDISDLQEATEHLSDGDTVYPYATEIEIEDALGVNAKDVKVKITAVQSGSGTPSPQNVRPIIGFDECEVERVGKNLLPMTVNRLKAINTSGTWNGNVYSFKGVTFTVMTDSGNNVVGIKLDGTSSIAGGGTDSFRLIEITELNQILDGNYIVNGCPSGGSTNTYRISVGSSGVDVGSGATVTTPLEGNRISIFFNNNITFNNTIFYPMIRIATDTDPTFEPYKGKTYTIQLGDTIYGGVIDVTTGVMTVTHRYKDLGTMSWTYQSTWQAWYSEINDIKMPSTSSDIANVIAENYETLTVQSVIYSHQIGIGVSNANNRVVVGNGSSESQPIGGLLYELATPFTIQLTPQQIQLLDGYTYLTANTGDIQVTTTDIQGAIGQADALIEANTQAIHEINSFDDSIFGTVENGTTASKAYAQGDYFVKDKKMCKALTSIAEGATFTLDTNYAAYTLADILKAIEQL